METIAIILCLVLAVTWGVIARDWLYRKEQLDLIEEALAKLETLETSYKNYLERIHSLDSSRAKQLADQQGAIESLNMRVNLGVKK